MKKLTHEEFDKRVRAAMEPVLQVNTPLTPWEQIMAKLEEGNKATGD